MIPNLQNYTGGDKNEGDLKMKNNIIISASILIFVLGITTATITEFLIKNIEPEETTWNETVAATNETTYVSTAIKCNPNTITNELECPVIEEEIESDTIAEEWKYPLTESEIDLIALVTMAEAEGETELGKRLVIDTILNRVDNSHFPDNVYDVIYQKNQFSSVWNSRIDRCYVMPDIVDLVKEELLDRTNYDCVFFRAGEYSIYGTPMFQECCHYFSSYN